MKKILFALIAAFSLMSAFCDSVFAQERPWLKYITPSGYYQAGYSIDSDGNNTFYLKRARISIGGSLLDDSRYGKLEYKVQTELAGSPKLVDYYFKYTLCSEFGIQFGQFKTPLSIENSEYAPLKLEMIDYSLLVQRFCRMSSADISGISASGRETGLQFYGKVFRMGKDHSLLQYNAAIFNGNGINKSDNDRRKDLMMRLFVYPVREFALSAYYMRSIGPVDGDASSLSDPGNFLFDRFGGGISYDSSFAWFRAEYMSGHTFGTTSEAAYGTVGYKLDEKVSVGFRYDYFNVDSKQKESFQQYYTAAFNWLPFRFLRMQLNYSYRLDPDRSPLHLVNLMTSISL